MLSLDVLDLLVLSALLLDENGLRESKDDTRLSSCLSLVGFIL